MKRNEQSLRDWWNTIKLHMIRIHMYDRNLRRRGEKEEERIFEEIAINFSNVRKICIKFLHLRSSTNLKQYKPKEAHI